MPTNSDVSDNNIRPESGTPSNAVETPRTQPTDSAKDEEELIRVLASTFLGRANNGALRKALDWEQDRYFAARNRLLDKSKVQKSHGGPGGTTFLVVQTEATPDSAAASAAAASPSVRDTYETEAALYEPMLRQIKTVWVKEEGYDSWLCRQTALAGRRDTGGK